MTLLTDNDIVLKLAAFDLLSETCAWLGIAPHEVQALATAKYRLRDPRLADTYGKEGLDRAVAFVGQTSVIGTPSDTKELDALTGAKALGYDIDAGEAALFAATSLQPPDFLLTTGDKRCLVNIARFPDAPRVRQRLARRVLCLEQVLLALIGQHGFAFVQARVWDARACDGSVRLAFGYSQPTGEADARAGLESFVRDLDAQTNGLLAAI